jgi:hypothetical protein
MGMPDIRSLARECEASGLWDEAQLEGFRLTAEQKICRTALHDEDEHGVPYALPISAGAGAKWKQVALFEFIDFAFVIGSQCKQLGEFHAKIKTLQDLCRQRFGTAPSIPDLA